MGKIQSLFQMSNPHSVILFFNFYVNVNYFILIDVYCSNHMLYCLDYVLFIWLSSIKGARQMYCPKLV